MPKYLVTTDDGKKYMVTTDGAPSQPQSFGQKAYGLAQDTVPYLAGAGAGMMGAPLGPEVSIPAAGLGYAGARSGLRGVGRMMGYEKPATLAEESKQTTLSDLPTGMAMEGAAPALKNLLSTQVAKRTGQGLADIFSVLPGLEKGRVGQLFKNPRSLLPPFLGGPPQLKETGEAISRMESQLGIPGLAEREGAQVLRVKPPSGMAEGEVKIKDPNRAFDIEKLKQMKSKTSPLFGSMGNRGKGVEDAIKELQAATGKASPEADRQVAARVFDEMKQGKLPELNDTIKAIRGVDNRLELMAKDPTTEESQNKVLLTQFRQKLINHLSEIKPELQKLRQQYAAGKTREAFVHPGFGLVSKDSGGELSKMGLARTISPYAIFRSLGNPALGALISTMQSPLALGASTALPGSILMTETGRKLTPYLINALIQRRKRENQ